jgi:hypothetical protein
MNPPVTNDPTKARLEGGATIRRNVQSRAA